MTPLEQLAKDMREHVDHQGCACAQMQDFLQRLEEALPFKSLNKLQEDRHANLSL